MWRERAEAVAAEFQSEIAPFIQDRVNPGTDDRDRTGACIPAELFRDAASLGLISFSLPPEFGGQGRSALDWGLLLEHMGYACDDLAFPVLLSYRVTIAKLLYASRRADLIERYADPMLRGAQGGGFAYSEGRDPFSFATRIRRRHDKLIVHGKKTVIAGGQTAAMFLVLARSDDDDLVGVIVERDDPGVSVAPVEAVGLRSAGLASLTLDDVELPPDRILAGSDAFAVAQSFFNDRRLELPCVLLGAMRSLFEASLAHVTTTVRYKLPLSQMQAVQAQVGRMRVALETSRCSVASALEAAVRGSRHPVWDIGTTSAKYYTVQQAIALCATAQSIVGGDAVFVGRPFERRMRDFACFAPLAGTQASLEVDLGILSIGEAEQLSRLEKERA